MRTAERYVAQGKLNAAIQEYQQIVDNDPRDFGTLNMLGDLYVKDSNKRAALRCYNKVAEHYSQQGFTQKAIAIYNKIARLDPDSVEVSAKLAELYRLKGSLSEAKSHYTTLADYYMSKGWRSEALAIWKQIALLDPNNTEVFVKLADAYLHDKDFDNAVEALFEAAMRFSRAGKHEQAKSTLLRALDARPSDIKCLRELIHQCKALGQIGEAIRKIEEVYRENQRNRDVARLLFDAYMEGSQPQAAEGVLIKLVELEPANYPKFLNLVGVYLTGGDATSASRAFSMCAEHLLMAGNAEEYQRWLNEILAVDGNNLNGLRLAATFYSWKRDHDGLIRALEKMAKAARGCGAFDEEKYALLQLTALIPHSSDHAERLQQINQLYGYCEETAVGRPDSNCLGRQAGISTGGLTTDFQFSMADVDSHLALGEPRIDPRISQILNESDPAGFASELYEEISGIEAEVISDDRVVDLAGTAPRPSTQLSASLQLELEKEVESITFYIQNEYAELAEKSIAEARRKFGHRPELDVLEVMLRGERLPTHHDRRDGGIIAEEFEPVSKSLDINEIRNEFGLDDFDASNDSDDYDTHYQLAVAYQEMGLLEEAIKEYQDAIALISPTDACRRFFQCATLLGHCFMQNGMAHLGLKWFGRALETPNLHDEERHGLWYEIAAAYEANGDHENASRYYEQVYSENVNFRDVSNKLKSIAARP